MLQDWDAVVAIGCTLPGVEPGTSYGRPALRFRGKTLASTTATPRADGPKAASESTSSWLSVP